MGRLDVRIVEARNLPDLDTFSKTDSYVRVQLADQTHKTSVAENSLNPKWDEVFKFVIADENSTQLEMTLWNHNTFSDDFLGRYNISVSGLTKGVVKDSWCLLQQCKTNAEIRIRLLAIDFGNDPAPGQQVIPPPQQPVAFQQQQPGFIPQQQIVQPQFVQQQIVQPQFVQQQQQQFGQPQFGQPQQGAGGVVRFPDLVPVNFTGPVAKATYGPPGRETDFTMQVNQMIQRGQTQVQGGIHTVLGDPAPGQAKTLTLAYANQPTETYPDLVPVNFRGPVVAATYGPPGRETDFTIQVNQLIQRGQRQVQGGIHTVLGDPAPGQAKTFKVWY